MKYIVLATIFLVCTACSESENTNAPIKSLSEPLEGLWKLQIMEVKDSTGRWKNWRDGMQGYLLYDGQGHMALHLLPKDYEKTDLVFPNFTDTISLEALKYITNNYNYFGTYEIDASAQIVTHNRISHSNPRDWHTEVQRRFSFNGDTLVVQPVEKENAKLRLKWLKQD